jgi:hypothetical protein
MRHRLLAALAPRRIVHAHCDLPCERAELTKHHLDVLWHDYFKPEHVEKFPNLHEVFWQATKQASKVKQTNDLNEAQKLLDLIDQVDEMWKATGGLEKTRVNGRPG